MDRTKLNSDEKNAHAVESAGSSSSGNQLPSGFDAFFMTVVLGGLVLFCVLVTVYEVWHWVLTIVVAAALSRVPLFLLVQLILVVGLLFVMGALIFS